MRLSLCGSGHPEGTGHRILTIRVVDASGWRVAALDRRRQRREARRTGGSSIGAARAVQGRRIAANCPLQWDCIIVARDARGRMAGRNGRGSLIVQNVSRRMVRRIAWVAPGFGHSGLRAPGEIVGTRAIGATPVSGLRRSPVPAALRCIRYAREYSGLGSRLLQIAGVVASRPIRAAQIGVEAPRRTTIHRLWRPCARLTFGGARRRGDGRDAALTPAARGPKSAVASKSRPHEKSRPATALPAL